MGLRGTEEGYAFKRLEDAQQAEQLCVALEKLFFKLKKAAPPSSAVTALPFLEIGEAAPATVVARAAPGSAAASLAPGSAASSSAPGSVSALTVQT